ncbi:polysialyltransferase family glycosyltransferase [Propionibacteriaceae bacterium Y1685]|uniref:polysialyltransferase family glycosyltransferase n=1 Tax=Microlunatus sp. Y1700 TaxID=3418487 RepID=UPI003B7C7E80
MNEDSTDTELLAPPEGEGRSDETGQPQRRGHLAPTDDTVEVFLASTLYGVATLAAALDAGLFADSTRRILVVSNHAETPETLPRLPESPGFAALADHFDEVVDLNEALSPTNPRLWDPAPSDLPILERHLRLLWNLGDRRIRLVVESIQASPAVSLAAVFADAAIDVYADGLMVYGPTRVRLPDLVGMRVERVIHPDLLPGVTPVLLSEWGSLPTPLDTDVLRVRFEQMAAEATPPVDGPFALVLGQYFAALGILDQAEEERLYVEMIKAAARRGHTRIVFKPHPTSQTRTEVFTSAVDEFPGVTCTVLQEKILAEVLFVVADVQLVVSCFSTAMVTARSIFGIPVVTHGTRMLLQRLKPFANSNRIPLVLIDHLLPTVNDADEPAVDPTLTQGLVTAVGYTMQGRNNPHLRDAAIEFLTQHFAVAALYIPRKRLTAQDLPGGHVPGRFDLREYSRRAQMLPVVGPRLTKLQRRVVRTLLR